MMNIISMNTCRMSAPRMNTTQIWRGSPARCCNQAHLNPILTRVCDSPLACGINHADAGYRMRAPERKMRRTGDKNYRPLILFAACAIGSNLILPTPVNHRHTRVWKSNNPAPNRPPYRAGFYNPLPFPHLLLP